jgi:predicted short-subunit dehydrogenase-like oxidoreductase (DUF2520 family)
VIQYNISFAGAGRVAGAFCREMHHTGLNIDMIVSESEPESRSLAEFCNASWSPDLVYPQTTDIIIVAVPDHKLQSVLSEIKCRPGTLVAHTAGSMGIDVFPEHITQKGVFYPLQTFSRDRKVNFRDLPLFIEASDKQSAEILENLGKSIGCKICFADAEHRLMLHLAAVFVSNFTNHMLTMGKEIGLRTGFQFDVLNPLIHETISKAMDIGPEYSQTGPAVRNDRNTIEKHLELLSFSPELQRIYSEMTRSITDYYNNKDKS